MKAGSKTFERIMWASGIYLLMTSFGLSLAFSSSSTTAYASAAPSKVNWGLNTSLGVRTTDRIFFNTESNPDVVQDGRVKGFMEGQTWGFYYQGGWSLHAINSILNNHAHKLKGEKLFRLPFRKSLLVWGGEAEVIDYKENYESYDRFQGSMYLGTKFYPHKRLMVKLFSNTEFSHYYRFEAYTYFSHLLRLQVTSWLPTKTTVRFEANWEYRRYFLSPALPETSFVDLDVKNAHTLRLYVRVAQSLARWAALRVWGAWEPSLNDKFRFNDTRSSGLELNFTADPTTIYGGSAGLEFEIRPRKLRSLRSTLFTRWDLRHYGGRKILDMEGKVIEPVQEREDNIFTTGISVSWKIPKIPGGFWGQGLFLHASYLFRYSKSNDEYYTYPQHMAYLGISTSWQ